MGSVRNSESAESTRERSGRCNQAENCQTPEVALYQSTERTDMGGIRNSKTAESTRERSGWCNQADNCQTPEVALYQATERTGMDIRGITIYYLFDAESTAHSSSSRSSEKEYC
jgi:hypothetical protein